MRVKYLTKTDNGNLVTLVKIDGKYGMFFGKDIYGDDVDIKPLIKEILKGKLREEYGFVYHIPYRMWSSVHCAIAEAYNTLSNMSLSNNKRLSYKICWGDLKNKGTNNSKWTKTSFSIFDVTNCEDAGYSKHSLFGDPYNPNKISNVETADVAIICHNCSQLESCNLLGVDILSCKIIEENIMIKRMDHRQQPDNTLPIFPKYVGCVDDAVTLINKLEINKIDGE